MKIILLGYMTSGKTSIGEKLAKELAIPFVDLDNCISKKEKLSISAIFKKKGELYFRKQEKKYLTKLLQVDRDFVLAVGGGTPCYYDNIDIINNNSKSFYLKASVQTIYNKISKIKNKLKRPLLAEIANKDLKEYISKHLFERSYFYQQAHKTIAIDSKSKKEIIKEINLNMQ